MQSFTGNRMAGASGSDSLSMFVGKRSDIVVTDQGQGLIQKRSQPVGGRILRGGARPRHPPNEVGDGRGSGLSVEALRFVCGRVRRAAQNSAAKHQRTANGGPSKQHSARRSLRHAGGCGLAGMRGWRAEDHIMETATERRWIVQGSLVGPWGQRTENNLEEGAQEP